MRTLELEAQVVEGCRILANNAVCREIVAENIPCRGGIEVLYHRMLVWSFNLQQTAKYYCIPEKCIRGGEIDLLIVRNDSSVIERVWDGRTQMSDASGMVEIKAFDTTDDGAPSKFSPKKLNELCKNLNRLRQLTVESVPGSPRTVDALLLLLIPGWFFRLPEAEAIERFSQGESTFWKSQAEGLGLCREDSVFSEFILQSVPCPSDRGVTGATCFLKAVLIRVTPLELPALTSLPPPPR